MRNFMLPRYLARWTAAFPLLLVNTFDWFASDDTESQLFEPLSDDECEGDAGGVCVAMANCQSPPDDPR